MGWFFLVLFFIETVKGSPERGGRAREGLAVSWSEDLAGALVAAQPHQVSPPQAQALYLVGLSTPAYLLSSYSAFRTQVKCPLCWEAFYQNGSL